MYKHSNRSWLLGFFFCAFVTLNAQIPDEVKDELTTHLESLTAGENINAGNRVYAIFTEFHKESDKEWIDYFTSYFSTHKLNYNLERFLKEPTFFDLSDGVHHKLQLVLSQTFISWQTSLFEQGQDLSYLLINEVDRRETLVSINKFLNTYFKSPSGFSSEFYPSIIDHYLWLVQKEKKFRKTQRFDLERFPFLGIIKSQIYATFSNFVYRDPSRNVDIELALGINEELGEYQHRLWHDQNVLVVDNGLFDENQFKTIYRVLQAIPDSLSRVTNINVHEVVSQDPYDIRSIAGITLFDLPVGAQSKNNFPQEVAPHPADVFTLFLLHEVNHHVYNFGVRRIFPGLHDQVALLIENAGYSPSNYLRSDFAEGYFQQHPDEFYALIADLYFANSYRTFELAIKRAEQGNYHSLDQFLLFASTFKLTEDSIAFYRMENDDISVENVAVEFNASGFITKLYINEFCPFTFILGTKHLVEAVGYPEIKAEIPDNGIDEDCNGEDLLSTSVNSFSSSINALKIFPNPTTESIQFETTIVGTAQITIMDAHGRRVYRSDNINNVSLSHLTPGLYFVEVLQKIDQKRFFGKMVLGQ